MQAQFEPKKAHRKGVSFVVFCREEPSFPFHWHYHPEYELTYILDSEGVRLVGDHVADYRAGELVFLGSNLPHTWASEEKERKPGKPHRALVLQFSRNYFSSELLELPEFLNVKALLEASNRGLQFHGSISSEVAKKMQGLTSSKGMSSFVDLISILDSLGRSKDCTRLGTAAFSPRLKLHTQARFERILKKIEESYQDEISLREIARASHMSPSSFCRFFRKMTQKSLIEYVNELRIARAHKLLIETDKSVSEIAFEIGFQNLSNFNRRFDLLTQMTPREYREHYRNSQKKK
jgi:AraC-like DNA-binding protein